MRSQRSRLAPCAWPCPVPGPAGPLGLPQLSLPVHRVRWGWELTLLALALACLASSSAYYFAEAGGASGLWPVAWGVGGRPWPGLRTLEASPC